MHKGSLTKIFSRLAGCCFLAVAMLSTAQEAPFVVDIRTLQCLEPDLQACEESNSPDSVYATAVNVGSRCRYMTAAEESIGLRWFDRCEPEFVHSHAQVCTIGRDDRLGCGLIDRDGEIVVPLVYDEVRYQEGQTITAVKYQGVWGYFSIDRERLLLTPQFSEVADYSEGLAYVMVDVEEPEDNAWIVNDQGLRLAVIPRKIRVEGVFRDGLLAAEIDGKWGYLNQYAEWQIPPQFVDVTSFSNGLATARYQSRPDMWAIIGPQGTGQVFFEGSAHDLGTIKQGRVPLSIGCNARNPSQQKEGCRRYCLPVAELKPGPLCPSEDGL